MNTDEIVLDSSNLLNFKVQRFQLENILAYEEEIVKIDAKCFLFQFYYSLFKVYNKSCYHEYSGKSTALFTKVFNQDTTYVKIKDPKENKFKL